MPTTAITLTLDAALLTQAEALARAAGTTLDHILAQLLQEMVSRRTAETLPPLAPEELTALKGILHLSPADEARGYRALVADEQAKKYGLQ